MNSYWTKIPAILALYPAIYGFTLQSSNAAVFSRYSYAQVILISAHIAAIFLFFVSEKFKKMESFFIFMSFIIFYLLTIFARANQAFRQMPLIELVWTTSRIFICAATFLYALKLIRKERILPANIFLMGGILFFILPLLDGVIAVDHHIWHWLPNPRTQNTPVNAGIQKSKYIPEKSSINTGDYLMIGDSFVAGNGASDPSKSFADLLNLELSKRVAGNSKLHSHGMSGASPEDYLRLLREIPVQKKLNRIILVIYLNDLDFSPYNNPLRLFILYHLDGASPGLQFLQTRLAATSWIADVNIYHQMLVKNFDPKDPSFNSRWQKFRNQITEFYNLSMERSQNRPLFVILPILENLAAYPLNDTHKMLAQAASSIGYETLDALDFFRKSGEDAIKLRASPNDNHFGDKGHAVVKDAILSKIHSVN